MIQRFSSRRQKLDKSFLEARLRDALAYDRIAGYFSSSLLEIAGEALESVKGPIRMVCNSELDLHDVETATAARLGLWRAWCASRPEELIEGPGEAKARERFKRLFRLLSSGKLQVRVLPESAFGLIHGKAGVITLSDGSKTSFLGSINESRAAWQVNYELLWEDPSPEAVSWVQEEFDALWNSPYSVSLTDLVIRDLERISERSVIRDMKTWIEDETQRPGDKPASAVIEAPVFRKESGLWEHQKYFVKMVFDSHMGPTGKARFVLADQVGLGKTLQLAISALLIALTGSRPILIICPKTLRWQWQGEMADLLEMPSAVWNGRQWVDENGISYPVYGPEGIRNCPRRVGIVSSGLITRKSESCRYLLELNYDCVILDEAHHARRRNLGENRDGEAPDPTNLLRFMYDIAERTRSLLLATATPVQIRPVEVWDLLDILSRGDDSVLGNQFSKWRHPVEALELVMTRAVPPEDEDSIWEWIRNPLPPKDEHYDFEILRRRLDLADDVSVVPGDAMASLRTPDRDRIRRIFPRFIKENNPFIRRIVRRTREQLENQIDPETKEPLLGPIQVKLHGEGERDAIILPPYLREAYELAEEFCRTLGHRIKASGFMKTLLLRRMGSSVYAGLQTAHKILESWSVIDTDEEEEEEEEVILSFQGDENSVASLRKQLTKEEGELLERLVAALEANKERDPKYDRVRELLLVFRWLDFGCIVFSQYLDSIKWLSELLTEDLPEEPIGLYSGRNASGIIYGGNWLPQPREKLKAMVMKGELRLLLGTDAASEGLNLQRMARLINLDLPWNPTRLEQRKGRIQRIGQMHDTVEIYNIRYKDSVEDRVHELLSVRLQNIYKLFGQLPDVLKDVWIAVALGEKERAKKIIDDVPESHPFELRYSRVEKIDWESCRKVLDRHTKKEVLEAPW